MTSQETNIGITYELGQKFVQNPTSCKEEIKRLGAPLNGLIDEIPADQLRILGMFKTVRTVCDLSTTFPKYPGHHIEIDHVTLGEDSVCYEIEIETELTGTACDEFKQLVISTFNENNVRFSEGTRNKLERMIAYKNAHANKPLSE